MIALFFVLIMGVAHAGKDFVIKIDETNGISELGSEDSSGVFTPEYTYTSSSNDILVASHSGKTVSFSKYKKAIRWLGKWLETIGSEFSPGHTDLRTTKTTVHRKISNKTVTFTLRADGDEVLDGVWSDSTGDIVISSRSTKTLAYTDFNFMVRGHRKFTREIRRASF